MTAKDLKNALLQEAVQGKLVPQKTCEGNARDLLEEIRKERLSHGLDFANAKSKKKGKKETALAGSNPCDISEDEIPFDIPESWCWCRLGEVVKNVNYGTSAKSHPSGNVPVLRMGNITKDGKLSFENLVYTSDEKEIETYKLFPGDMLFNRTNSAEWVGKTTVYKGERPAIFAGYIIRYTPILIDSEYMNVVMNTSYQKKWCSEVKTNGVQQCNINAQNLLKFILPLPPLSEQKRIVAAIEKFMPLIEEYGKKETVLNELNAQIGTLTKKAILQEAVQGKLVPQIPSEGNAKDLLEEIRKSHTDLQIHTESAGKKKGDLRSKSQIRVTKKEKPLPEITENEIPFDIPENWCWCRLGEIITIKSGDGLTASQMKEGSIPVFGGNGVTGYHNLANIHEETIVIGRVGFYCGSVHITPKEAWVTDNAFITTYPEKQIDRNFLVHVLRHLNLGQDNNATAQPVVSGKKIYPLLFPLPPLSEQKRIVAAIEQLLPLCEKLGK